MGRVIEHKGKEGGRERERANFVVFMKRALDFELAVDGLEVVGPACHNFGDFIELAIIPQLLVVHQLLLRQQLQPRQILHVPPPIYMNPRCLYKTCKIALFLRFMQHDTYRVTKSHGINAQDFNDFMRC